MIWYIITFNKGWTPDIPSDGSYWRNSLEGEQVISVFYILLTYLWNVSPKMYLKNVSQNVITPIIHSCHWRRQLQWAETYIDSFPKPTATSSIPLPSLSTVTNIYLRTFFALDILSQADEDWFPNVQRSPLCWKHRCVTEPGEMVIIARDTESDALGICQLRRFWWQNLANFSDFSLDIFVCMLL